MNIGYFSDILPLRMIWLSGLFRIIGGGDPVLVSNALTMVADMSSEEERYPFTHPIDGLPTNCAQSRGTLPSLLVCDSSGGLGNSHQRVF